MSLEERLDRMESIEEIKKLKHEYMNWCDLGYPPEHIGPMFLDDASGQAKLWPL